MAVCFSLFVCIYSTAPGGTSFPAGHTTTRKKEHTIPGSGTECLGHELIVCDSFGEAHLFLQCACQAERECADDVSMEYFASLTAHHWAATLGGNMSTAPELLAPDGFATDFSSNTARPWRQDHVPVTAAYDQTPGHGHGSQTGAQDVGSLIEDGN